MPEQKNENTNVEIEAQVSKGRLSMKAKGAGILILLAISIGGIIFIAFLMYRQGESGPLIGPVMLLLFISYQLINVLHSLFNTGMYISND